MKANPMRAALERGDLQLGTWINLVRNPAILPLLKSAGLDFARFDVEHSSPSIETVADMAVLARALDFPLVVRPPKANREWITRLLDVGVWNSIARKSRPRSRRLRSSRQPIMRRWVCEGRPDQAPATTMTPQEASSSGVPLPTSRSS